MHCLQAIRPPYICRVYHGHHCLLELSTVLALSDVAFSKATAVVWLLQDSVKITTRMSFRLGGRRSARTQLQPRECISLLQLPTVGTTCQNQCTAKKLEITTTSKTQGRWKLHYGVRQFIRTSLIIQELHAIGHNVTHRKAKNNPTFSSRVAAFFRGAARAKGS